MARLARITIFPIKALAGVELDRCGIAQKGALRGDREFAMVDEQERFVNGKRHTNVTQLHAEFDLAERTVALRGTLYALEDGNPDLEKHLSDFFGFRVFLRRDERGGFPDDTNLPGPTLISTSTLREIGRWYPGTTLEQIRRRFRTNLEIDDVPAFWEDCLGAQRPAAVPFLIGGVRIHGMQPCKRCIVPSLHPESGEQYAGFQRTFVERRERLLPAWARRESFTHWYSVAINTMVPESEYGKVLVKGAPVNIEVAIGQN